MKPALHVLIKIDMMHTGDYKPIVDIINKFNGKLTRYGESVPRETSPKIIKYERPFI